jgi:hypothetical protein
VNSPGVSSGHLLIYLEKSEEAVENFLKIPNK